MLVLCCGQLEGPLRAQCTVDVNTVSLHAGSFAVFCGTPTGIKCTESAGDEPLYIDFGGAYPQEAFSIVLPASVAREDCEHLRERFMGHTLRVEGQVEMLVGKPVIRLDDDDDIVIATP